MRPCERSWVRLIQNKAVAMLGLAAKAGKVFSGEFSTERAVKDGKAKLVIVAEDASDNTKKLFKNMCTYYRVPIYFLCSKSELGHSIGKEFRASVAVTDGNLADSIVKKIEAMKQTPGHME